MWRATAGWVKPVLSPHRDRRTLLLISSRAASVAKLASDNLVAKNSSLESEQERIEAEQDLADYAALKGDLITVSRDAASDERLGLIYPSRLHLEKTSMFIDSKHVDLSAGMAVTVEIKTG